MPTRAEQFRAAEEIARSRSHQGDRAAKSILAARRKRPASHESAHAARKATYAFEAHEEHKRPSRKSSRKGANRLKADLAFNLREEMTKGSPEARHAKAAAQARRVRGRR
jgi:hypothetical protein